MPACPGARPRTSVATPGVNEASQPPAHVGFEFELRSAEIRGAGKIGTVPAFPRPAAMAVRPAFADLNGLQVRLRWHYDEITGVIFGNWASAKLWQGYEADL